MIDYKKEIKTVVQEVTVQVKIDTAKALEEERRIYGISKGRGGRRYER